MSLYCVIIWHKHQYQPKSYLRYWKEFRTIIEMGQQGRRDEDASVMLSFKICLWILLLYTLKRFTEVDIVKSNYIIIWFNNKFSKGIRSLDFYLKKFFFQFYFLNYDKELIVQRKKEQISGFWSREDFYSVLYIILDGPACFILLIILKHANMPG